MAEQVPSKHRVGVRFPLLAMPFPPKASCWHLGGPALMRSFRRASSRRRFNPAYPQMTDKNYRQLVLLR